MTLSALVAAALTGIVFSAARPRAVAPPAATAPTPASLTTAATLAALLSTPDLPADTDPALLNLACCPALPADPTGAALAPYLKTLDHWADTVAETTRRNHHRYLENPKEFASEPEWKLAMMCTVIGQDFKVRYDPTLTSTTQQLASNGVFFANPHAVFLTGCLNDSRSGTCASLPVLYVAIGRRLGYPMYLVTAKSHVFARWDDGHGVVVNLEAANSGGFTSHPDSHYRSWPRPISAAEEQAGSYLKNLTPIQTLAVFLSLRAATLQAAGKDQEAIAAAATAYRLAPTLGGIRETLTSTMNGAIIAGAENVVLDQQRQLARQRQQPVMPGLPPEPQPGIPYPGQPFVPSYPQAPIPAPFPMPGTPQVPRPGFPQPTTPYQPTNPYRPTPP